MPAGTGYASFNKEHLHEIEQKTGVRVRVCKRMMVMTGAAAGIDEARSMVEHMIRRNQLAPQTNTNYNQGRFQCW